MPHIEGHSGVSFNPSHADELIGYLEQDNLHGFNDLYDHYIEMNVAPTATGSVMPFGQFIYQGPGAGIGWSDIYDDSWKQETKSQRSLAQEQYEAEALELGLTRGFGGEGYQRSGLQRGRSRRGLHQEDLYKTRQDLATSNRAYQRELSDQIKQGAITDFYANLDEFNAPGGGAFLSEGQAIRSDYDWYPIVPGSYDLSGGDYGWGQATSEGGNEYWDNPQTWANQLYGDVFWGEDSPGGWMEDSEEAEMQMDALTFLQNEVLNMYNTDPNQLQGLTDNFVPGAYTDPADILNYLGTEWAFDQYGGAYDPSQDDPTSGQTFYDEESGQYWTSIGSIIDYHGMTPAQEIGDPGDSDYLQNVGNWQEVHHQYIGDAHQAYDPWLDMLGYDEEWFFGDNA